MPKNKSMVRLSNTFTIIVICSVLSGSLMLAYINARNENYDAIIDAPNTINARPHEDSHLIINTTDSSGNKWAKTPSIRQCKPNELLIIKRQLPPDDCLAYKSQPWLQKCSMSYATRCPDAVWLENYYIKLHSSVAANQSSMPPTFLAVFVGCNKGFDAVNAIRMGSGKPVFEKGVWRDAITQHGKMTLHHDVCNEVTHPQFALSSEHKISIKDDDIKHSHLLGGGGGSSSSFSQVHCIEPMPATARELQRAASETKYDKEGFVVMHAAMAKEDGYVFFPPDAAVGVENKGISNAGCSEGMASSCIKVATFSLDTYMEKFIPKGVQINYLSVDVEGWDFEVLLGGKQTLLQVHYLEFEYNWVGPWKRQPLSEVIEYLDGQYGFSCYWAGFNNTVWRITNCWLDHYEAHFWSNIACVNRNIRDVQDIAHNMEHLFMETLAKGGDAVRDFNHRFQRSNE